LGALSQDVFLIFNLPVVYFQDAVRSEPVAPRRAASSGIDDVKIIDYPLKRPVRVSGKKISVGRKKGCYGAPNFWRPIVIPFALRRFFLKRGMMSQNEFRVPISFYEFHLLVIQAWQSLAVSEKRRVNDEKFVSAEIEDEPRRRAKIFFKLAHCFRRHFFAQIVVAGDKDDARGFYFGDTVQKQIHLPGSFPTCFGIAVGQVAQDNQSVKFFFIRDVDYFLKVFSFLFALSHSEPAVLRIADQEYSFRPSRRGQKKDKTDYYDIAHFTPSVIYDKHCKRAAHIILSLIAGFMQTA
jgi:hypothetical protein